MLPVVALTNPLKKFWLCLIVGLAAWRSFEWSAKATTAVNVSWNGVSDTNVVGYKLYFGTFSQEYTNTIVAGNVTNTYLSGITPGATYYFAVTSYNAAGWESAYSTEVAYTAPAVAGAPISIAQTPGGFNITVNGTAAMPYVILASTDLVNWVALTTNTAPFVFTDSNSAGYPERFYQAVPASAL
jgi:hypothetical protein